jgi:NADPH-dependent glutamate synthase beta subunit-like oxidoreductase/Pyruvate/2-oxoacid:ferredoxin oxidoreductase delta subunit
MPMTIEMKNRLLIPLSSITSEGNKTGSWRFLRPRFENKTAPCSAACPVGEDIPQIEMLAARGDFKEAWETILRENPFPAVCGRVCFHPCEGLCNRGNYDEAVAVHTLERFVADTAVRYEFHPPVPNVSARKERIAIIGGGPAGLSAAWFLTRLGFPCDIFEAAPEVGGLLRWGIPAYRLPRAALLQDVLRLQAAGVGIFTNHPGDEKFLTEDDRYQAAIVATGHGAGQKMDIPGETAEDVTEGLDFLRKLRTEEPINADGTTAVIGGGNTAVDVARSVVRLGGKAVIYYRRRRQDMPAFAEEIRMAIEEGVEIQDLVAPAEVKPDGGELLLSLQRMVVSGEDAGRSRVASDGGSATVVKVKRVIRAIGAGTQAPWMAPSAEGSKTLALSHSRVAFGKARPIVYTGDLVTETKSVTHAIASGKQAAIALDIFFREGAAAIQARLSECLVGEGNSLSMEVYLGGERKSRSRHVVGYSEINTDYFSFTPRIKQPRLLVEERKQAFSEIDLKISAGIAMQEAARCFNCGFCNNCDNCRLFCPDIAVLREEETRQVNYDYCKGCGICVVECPRNAMSLEEEGNE